MFRHLLRNLQDIFISKRRVHLDHASATPVHPEVFRAMQPYFSARWANPGAIHREGVMARTAVEEARIMIARTLHVRAEDVIFTSGGTESNNLAMIGLVTRLHENGRAYGDMEVISTRIEHPSILEALAYLETLGVSVRYVPVQESGRMDTVAFPTLLSDRTVLVACTLVNSEIGVIQDIKRITRAVRAWNTAHGAQIRVHVDASQAPLWLSCAPDALGADLLALDAGKCEGPKGVGVLVRRHGVPLQAITYGGGQEGGLRSGTENVPLVVGCAYAIRRAQAGFEKRAVAVAAVRDAFFRLLETRIPEAVVNGSREHRVANNVNISIPGYDSEYAVLWLDAEGVAASTKSACGVGKSNGSEMVRVTTGDDARALSTIRFTLGETTSLRDVERAVRSLERHIARMRPSVD